MSRTVLMIDNANVKFGALPTAPAPIDPATLTDYSCQVTEARITATVNSTDVPATFCEPKSKINAPSSFDLVLAGLQDWGLAAGSLSEYLFVHDAEEAAFALYLADSDDPAASGVVSLAAGDFGGVAGTPLVLSLTLPIQGYPDITSSTGTSLRSASTAMTAREVDDDTPGPEVAATPEAANA